MADKGFNIKGLLVQIEVTLNTPPSLSEKGQFDEEEVETTQSVASVRIHVERAISRIKMYKSINNVVPLSLAEVLNQIWTLCCMLLLFQSPNINQENEEDLWFMKIFLLKHEHLTWLTLLYTSKLALLSD